VNLAFVSADNTTIILTSNLKQDSLCPGPDGRYEAADFLCLSSTSHVIWNINGREIIFQRGEAGERIQVDNHVATLLRCSEEYGYTSVLNVVEVPGDNLTTVQCYNQHTDFDAIEYYHRVSGTGIDTACHRHCMPWWKEVSRGKELRCREDDNGGN
jgi:hypothetical protein